LGSPFIEFRNEAATLRGKALTLFAFCISLSCFCILSYLFLPEALHRAEERADDLVAKHKASEEACKRAEKDDVDVKDLRQRLQAAEDALSDKEAKKVKRENDISMRLETQSRRFSSKTIFPFSLCFSLR
jgi:hypothetical protein